MQHTNAGVAQSVEQLIRNQQVAGSSPATSSKAPKPYGFGAFQRGRKTLFGTLADCQKGSEDEQLTPVGVYRYGRA